MFTSVGIGIGIGFLFGVIVGSFLNVVILRTHTKRSLGGHSHCMSCGERLGVQDLIPLLSYVFLRGRCRQCGARISPRYFLVELTSGILFACMFSLSLSPVALVLHVLFLALLLVIFVYDIEHLIIPDEYVLALIPLALLLAVGRGEAVTVESSMALLLGGALSFAFLGGLWKVSDGRWIGLGDAKLSVPLAVAVGLSSTFSLIVFAFWIGAVVSVSLLCVAKLFVRGQKHLLFSGVPLTMKAEVPFAPFLIGSFLVVYFAHADVFIITNTFLSYLPPFSL